MDDLKLEFYIYKGVKDHFEKNKIKEIILFSQAKSGSTFVTNCKKKSVKNYKNEYKF
tara:strand:+ start:57 stop:227 length:171 start_codon:yes stop_codon:yes gene_type:complete